MKRKVVAIQSAHNGGRSGNTAHPGGLTKGPSGARTALPHNLGGSPTLGAMKYASIFERKIAHINVKLI
jgi:hypothetical protein